jgi:hypothetical protein
MGRIPYRYESAENSLAGTEALLDESVAVLGDSEPDLNRNEELQVIPSDPRSGDSVLSTDSQFDRGLRLIWSLLACCRMPVASKDDIETGSRSVRRTARRLLLRLSQFSWVGLIEAAILRVPLWMNVHGAVSEFDTHDCITIRIV